MRTSRTGAIAKAGHDLLMHVTEWSATLDTGDAPSLTLDADGTSLRVREGTGGIKPLDDDDLTNIETTIDDEVLLKRDITFRSTSVQLDGDTARGRRRPDAARHHAAARVRLSRSSTGG